MTDPDIFDPFDMDREEFNPNLCMVRYAEDCNLSNMMSRKHHIDEEISQLHSDLQNMLYDNYSKFIDAASIVSTMKTDFQKMEDEIDHLHAKMNIIEKTSSGILANLRPTETKVCQLLKCQDIMKKLVLLTDLVPTLRVHVDSGAFCVAARYYLKAKNLLNKYKHLASLGGIAKDCAEIVVLIKYGLLNKLNCDIYGKEELSETLNLILALGETPSEVAKHFLSCADKCLISHLSSIEDTWEKDNKENIQQDSLMNIMINYIGLCCNYVEKIEKVINVIKHVFFTTDDKNIKESINELLNEFFTENIDLLSIKLERHVKEQFQNMDDDFLSQVLDKFIRQCHSSGILTPQLSIFQKGMDITLKICMARCEFHLENIKQDFNSILISLEKELLFCKNYRKLLAFLEEWTEHKLTEVLKFVTCYIRPEFRCCREVTFRKVFSKIFVREGIFVAFFQHIKEQILLMVMRKHTKQPVKASASLILAKYLLDLQKNVVPLFLQKVDGCLCSTSENLCLSSDAVISTGFFDSAQKVIERYVYIRSQNMTCMVQKSMENKNWIEVKEPIRPRAVIKILLNEIQEIKTETEKLFGTYGNQSTDRHKDIGNSVFFTPDPNDRFPERPNIEERVLLNKIFNECSKIPRKAEPNSYSIIKCILKKVLISFIEYIRLNTLSCFGLQQIQVDICYFQSCISRLLDFKYNIQSLFDEIIASAYNRSLKPEFMNNQVVSVICSHSI